MVLAWEDNDENNEGNAFKAKKIWSPLGSAFPSGVLGDVISFPQDFLDRLHEYCNVKSQSSCLHGGEDSSIYLHSSIDGILKIKENKPYADGLLLFSFANPYFP